MAHWRFPIQAGHGIINPIKMKLIEAAYEWGLDIEIRTEGKGFTQSVYTVSVTGTDQQVALYRRSVEAWFENMVEATANKKLEKLEAEFQKRARRKRFWRCLGIGWLFGKKGN